MEKDKYPQFVFIVGSGRSGTTLLRNILQNHSDIGVTPELRFFDWILASRKKFGNLANSRKKKKFVERIFKKISQSGDPLWGAVNLDREAIRNEFLKCNNYKDYFSKLAEFTSSRKNPKILIEKTPENIFFLSEIFSFFPEAKVIHMVRDGREFCASAKKFGFGKANINLVAWWIEAIRSYDKFLKKFPGKRKNFLEIKYEDLIERPREVLDKTFSFLRVKRFSEEKLKKILKDLPSFSSFFSEEKAGLYKSSHFIKHFTLREQKEIESLLYFYLRRRYYSVVFIKSSIFLRMRLLFEVIKLRLHLWFKKRGYFWIYTKVKNSLK